MLSISKRAFNMRLLVQTVTLDPEHYLLVPSRHHKAATVPHTSKQGCMSPKYHRSSYRQKVTCLLHSEATQELHAHHTEDVLFYIHTYSPAEGVSLGSLVSLAHLLEESICPFCPLLYVGQWQVCMEWTGSRP